MAFEKTKRPPRGFEPDFSHFHERSRLYDAVKKAGMYKDNREYTDEYKAYRASGASENGVSIKEMEDDFK